MEIADNVAKQDVVIFFLSRKGTAWDAFIPGFCLDKSFLNSIIIGEAKCMGHIYAEIKLRNPRLPELKAIDVRAMVDTGALTLCIPEHIALQLKLETDNQREVTTADGRKQMVP